MQIEDVEGKFILHALSTESKASRIFCRRFPSPSSSSSSWHNPHQALRFATAGDTPAASTRTLATVTTATFTGRNEEPAMELSKHNSQRLTRNFSSLARRCHNHDRDHWFHSSPSTSSQAAALFSTAPSTPTSSHATDDEDEPSSGMTNPSYKDEIINSFRRIGHEFNIRA